MVIMYMQYIYHIAIRRERRVGTKKREVRELLTASGR